jgi:ABC-type uncharacterized transport system permease subunit
LTFFAHKPITYFTLQTAKLALSTCALFSHAPFRFAFSALNRIFAFHTIRVSAFVAGESLIQSVASGTIITLIFIAVKAIVCTRQTVTIQLIETIIANAANN